MTPTHLTPAELHERWREQIASGTLRNWRSEGRGPAYEKIGRVVLYPLAAVEAFERDSTVHPVT